LEVEQQAPLEVAQERKKNKTGLSTICPVWAVVKPKKYDEDDRGRCFGSVHEHEEETGSDRPSARHLCG
jgi:hypothetical protein